jgi:hypothetical protein
VLGSGDEKEKEEQKKNGTKLTRSFWVWWVVTEIEVPYIFLGVGLEKVKKRIR